MKTQILTIEPKTYDSESKGFKKKYKIIFDKIGRQNYCGEFVKEFEELYEAEVWAYNHANKFLVSGDTSLTKIGKSEKDNSWAYKVYAGFYNVGMVYIDEVTE